MISINEAVILGFIQGLTEFLPISSSGHLVLFQSWLGISSHQLFLDAMLHFGTLLAVVIFFWHDVLQLIKALPLLLNISKYGKNFEENSYFRLLCLIILGTVPTVVIGFTLKDHFERMFSSPLIVCFTLMITGVILYTAEMVKNTERELGQISIPESLFIGLMQGAAITPGISRSGSTIAAAMWRRISPEAAARFSFLLSMPAILGANILEAQGVWGKVSQPELLAIGLGTLVALISGLAALKLLMILLERRRLKLFAYYCWGLGASGLLYFGLLA